MSEKALVRRTVSAKAREMARSANDARREALAALRRRAKDAPALLEAYQKLVKSVAEFAQGGLLFHWRLGAEAYEIQAQKQYGESDVEILAEALGVSSSTVYRSIALARMWPDERSFRRDVLDRGLPGGGQVGITHLFHIVHIPEDAGQADIHAHRREMLELVFAEGLTTRALEAEIAQRFPAERPADDKKAKGAASPRTLLGAVRKMATVSEKLARQFEDWAGEVLGPLSKAAPGHLGRRPELVADNLARDIEALSGLAYQASCAAEELQMVKDKLDESSNPKKGAKRG